MARIAPLTSDADTHAVTGHGVTLASPTLAPRSELPLGQILVEDGAVDPGNLLKATILRRRENARLGEILLGNGWVTPEALARALSRQWRTTAIDPDLSPADPRLIDAAGAGFCLTQGVLPWRRIGGVTWIATARPDQFMALLPRLPAEFGTVRMLLCTEEQA
ncbi:MAG: hypothetical protein ACK41U_16805 [Paracoccus sp. (in: a-proteobacteria)]|uniref:GspE/PulE/PilB domain-containing protein n=1 Tax=Paracoccus sp. TaxID=267 RepID=UPI003918A78D